MRSAPIALSPYSLYILESSGTKWSLEDSLVSITVWIVFAQIDMLKANPQYLRMWTN